MTKRVPEKAQALICPRCTSPDIFRHGSILSSRGRVQRYECRVCHKKFHPSLKSVPLIERECFLDIECSQLKSSFGHIYCIGIKARGGPIQIFSLKQRTLRSEKRMLRAVCRALRKFDRIYTYNGTRFDVPYMLTRCLYHGITDFPEYMQLYHRDLYYVARGRLATLHSKRLEAVCRFLGIEGKTPLDPEIWVKAGFNDTFKASMKYLIEHNKGDVVILEKFLDRVEPYFRGVNRSI